MTHASNQCRLAARYQEMTSTSRQTRPSVVTIATAPPSHEPQADSTGPTTGRDRSRAAGVAIRLCTAPPARRSAARACRAALVSADSAERAALDASPSALSNRRERLGPLLGCVEEPSGAEDEALPPSGVPRDF